MADGSLVGTPDVPILERWPLNAEGVIHCSYDGGDEQLRRLYEKAKAQQWNVEDYDWSFELNPDNPLDMPDATLLIYGTPLWEQLDEKGRADVRRHFQSWTLSQVLHGEQGAMLCAAKLAQSEEQAEARLCAAAQTFDEARHIEVFQRLVDRKMRIVYPMSSSLTSILRDTVTSRELDLTNLGMQVLVEGIALSIFQNVVAYSRNPFVKEIVTKVQRDESRHFAVGRITLRRLYTQGELSSAEMRRREDFACEGIHVLHEHLCADDIWQPLGWDRKLCSEVVRSSRIANTLRRGLFRRLVPSLRDMGLLRGKVTTLLEQLGMIDYADLPLRADA
jgi:hypothetical protein